MTSSRQFRMTRQRQVILEELEKVDTHPTADEIYEMVRRRLPRISLSTVYRNLDILCERGKIRRLELGGSQRRFDASKEAHYHVHCIYCGNVEDVRARKALDIERAFGQASDYDIVSHRLELLGICPRCKRQGQGRRRGAD